MADIGFFDSYFVWRDAVVVSVLCGAVLSFLGVWIVLKRVVYMPLALSQVSSAGVMVAYLLGTLWGSHAHAHDCGVWLDPFWFSLLAALSTALWFSRSREDASISMVAAWLLASAAVLLMGGFVRQDLHDLSAVLFGNAVLVEPVQILYTGTAALVVMSIHRLWYGRFLFVSFDPDAAGAAGINTQRVETLLYATFALMISIATRALGALPAFGLMVLPAMTALRLCSGMRSAFLVSTGIGVGVAVLGYYLSFQLSLPTGATMVAIAGIGYLCSLCRPLY